MVEEKKGPSGNLVGDGILVAIVATEKQKVIVFNPKYPNRSFCDVPVPCLLCNFFGSRLQF